MAGQVGSRRRQSRPKRIFPFPRRIRESAAATNRGRIEVEWELLTSKTGITGLYGQSDGCSWARSLHAALPGSRVVGTTSTPPGWPDAQGEMLQYPLHAALKSLR